MIDLRYGRDCLEVLREMPSESVHVVCTSPPYFRLRRYLPAVHPDAAKEIGTEDSLDAFVANLVTVFGEVRRVLHKTGTLWVNLSDSYNSGTQFNHHQSALGKSPRYSEQPSERSDKKWGGHRQMIAGIKPKSLCMIPWRFAIAMQEQGWYVRDVVAWTKPSPMPESVTDRCTRSWEPIFMFAKSAHYFADMEAVKELAARPGDTQTFGGDKARQGEIDEDDPRYRNGSEQWGRDHTCEATANLRNVWGIDDESALLQWLLSLEGGEDLVERFLVEQQNRRNIWRLSAEAFKGQHFAAFPRSLPERCIKIGTSAKGCCPHCLAPWRRITERTKLKRSRPNDLTKRTGEGGTGNHCANTVAGVDVKTVGWEPTCTCGAPDGFRQDDFEVIESPTGERAGEDPSLETGRAGMNRPRGDGEGTRPMTRYEQRQYAKQLKASPHREDMASEAHEAFAHYVRTDKSGARPIPHDLLERWIGRGWLERIAVPEWIPPEPIACRVLDPFSGSGTTGEVAFHLGRDYIGIDLSSEYLPLARERCGGLFVTTGGAGK